MLWFLSIYFVKTRKAYIMYTSAEENGFAFLVKLSLKNLSPVIFSTL